MENNIFLEEIRSQNRKNKAAAEFINVVSDLWYENSIEIILFRQQVIDRGITEILNLLDYARKFVEKPINIHEVLEMSKAIQSLDLPMARLDIGKLTYECLEEKADKNKKAFVSKKLKGIEKSEKVKPKDVVLYGFGRIGRLVARELTSRAGKGSQLRLRAIVVRGEITPENLEKRAALLRSDSVHGHFPGTVSVDLNKKALVINGTTIF